MTAPTVLSCTFKSFWILALLAASMAGGCGRDESADPRAPQSGDGVIQGRVVFSGQAPEMKIIPGSPMIHDESIVVGPHNGLKNVIVFLKDAPKPAFTLNSPAILDQVKCMYVPHVLAVQTGQTLRLKSSDALMHNVHLKCLVNPDANYGFANIGQRDITLASPEPPFLVKCDVHPWMSAWIGVFDHPWFAVTGEDGTFKIEHVPPGKYTLCAWQEVLPQQEQSVIITETGETEADFTFQSP